MGDSEVLKIHTGPMSVCFGVGLFQNIEQQPRSSPTAEQADVLGNRIYKPSWEAAGHAPQSVSQPVSFLLNTRG